MDDKCLQDENKTDDFKAEVQKASEELAMKIAFWREWIPGGLRKRKRYRTKGHGARRSKRRRKNRVARASRKRTRPHKKRRK